MCNAVTRKLIDRLQVPTGLCNHKLGVSCGKDVREAAGALIAFGARQPNCSNVRRR